jgi:hypothetical protein
MKFRDIVEGKALDPKDVVAYLVKTGVNPKDAEEAVKKGFDYANKKYGGATYKAAVKKVAEVVWTLHESTDTVNEDHFKVGDEVKCIASGMTGKVVKLDKDAGDAYYVVKREDGSEKNYKPEELKILTEGMEDVIADVKHDGNTIRVHVHGGKYVLKVNGEEV